MVEHELKCMLTKRQFRKLLELVKTFYKYNITRDTQTNYYYDTPDLFFDRNHTTIRIREKEGNRRGTIKIHAVNECECSDEIPFEVKNIPAKLDYQGKELIMHGALTTHRISIMITPYISLCLDENYYLGTTDHELEIEYEEGHHAEAWKWLMLVYMMLHKGRYRSAYHLCYAKYKSARFFMRLMMKGSLKKPWAFIRQEGKDMVIRMNAQQ